MSDFDTFDLYQVLGVERDASEAEIRDAFNRAALTEHPDRSGHPDAEQRIRRVYQARDTLLNAKLRAAYDPDADQRARREAQERERERERQAPPQPPAPATSAPSADASTSASAAPTADAATGASGLRGRSQSGPGAATQPRRLHDPHPAPMVPRRYRSAALLRRRLRRVSAPGAALPERPQVHSGAAVRLAGDWLVLDGGCRRRDRLADHRDLGVLRLPISG